MTVHLVPVTPSLEQQLYQSVASYVLPWQWMGQPNSFDGFRHSLWARALCNFELQHHGKALGLAGAYGANFQNGTAYVHAYLLPEYQGSLYPLGAIGLMFDHLYSRYSLRKLYAEVLDTTLPVFRSAIDSGLFDVEGRLREFVFANGSYRDVVIISTSRDGWIAHSEKISERVKRFREIAS